ncbi:hypothetical protein DL769_008325 [Monosporascus sp. CRB-8-3]|nr:hypothetical protein DL769_008325 [Monosporascus sp. CRB-8-3]
MAGRITFLMKKFIHHEPLEVLKVVGDFFDRPWFSRRWVIQEACLARNATVHCGSQSIPLSMLSVAATRFQRMDMSDYAIKTAANLGSQTTQLSMLELLWNFHEAACLEPKDRIAALFNLDFSFVELESSGQKIGYGIGPEQMQINDIMIPLWRLEEDNSRSELHFDAEDVEIHITTMLADDRGSMTAGKRLATTRAVFVDKLAAFKNETLE